ncbi:MAG: hypothetical protein BroJett011_58230 [Chloroflexota bacterium]|nr:MAG: hypothetical protein BroJett011_58230 [Chloroflexota bacterium]
MNKKIDSIGSRVYHYYLLRSVHEPEYAADNEHGVQSLLWFLARKRKVCTPVYLRGAFTSP